jgi:hypothetical protein
MTNANTVFPPYPIFYDDDGNPLKAGYIYIGTEGENPETSPVAVYWDAAKTVPAAQPIRTLNGYPSRNGSPAVIFAEGDFSLTVKDKNGVLVASELNAAYRTIANLGTDFEDVAALKANATEQPVGSILRTRKEGFSFEVVSTGEHWTTDNGVKVQVLPLPKGGFNVLAFGYTGDGSSGDTAKFQAAVTAAAGRPLYVPAGTYIIDTTIDMESASASTFNQGPQIIGEGLGKTIFDNQVSSGPMFDVKAGGTPGTNFSMGARLEGFKVIRTTTQSAQIAIQIITSYMVDIVQVHIDGMTGTGIRIPCIVGDNDGSNMVNLDHVRIENCSGWGIDAKGNSGFNETSFIEMEHVFIQACGTASGSATPPSGGMQWKGQILTMHQCAFTLNENVALFIPGEAGLAQTCDLQSTTFENNNSKSVLVTGIKMFRGRNVQFYNNDSFTATKGIQFDASSFTIANVEIDGAVIRATSGNNAYTAFEISGANADLKTCQIRNVNFDNFGHAGQTKQSGFKDAPTVLAYKDSAQSLSSSAATILFNQETKDHQSAFNTTTGRYTVPYVGVFNIKGQITISSPGAGREVVVSLYDVSNANTVSASIYASVGIANETFQYDFTAELGAAGTTRDYEIRASISVGTPALNISSNAYNIFSARRIPNGEVEF